MQILKSSGQYEEFSKEKLELSLRRSGASEKNIEYVCNDIEKFFSSEKKLSTSKIYKRAFTILKKVENKKVVFRYSVKKAINELGPSGFPFEKFVAGIYSSLG
jgi:transcriptional regulator NrdR family protein